MTSEEAKFILTAFRPNGSDSGDSAFADALRMADDDPMLGQWFARSRAHDSAVAGKLGRIAPPAGLREAILAGARVSKSDRGRGTTLAWAAGLAAAAVLAIIVGSIRTPGRPESAATGFAGFAISDVVNERHGGRGEPSGALVARLEAKGVRMPAAGEIDFERLRDTGCRTLNFAGHDVLEVCFARDGVMFHFYVTRRDGALADSIAKGPSFISEASGAAAVWSDSQFDYALASTAGIEAIRRLL